VGDTDAATDQFALAVIAYEMLTGRNPFKGDTIADIFSRVAHGDPAPMEAGREVELVVRRGLAKSNRQRFASVTDFSDAFRAAATRRARDSQRSAIIAYAKSEVANSESKARSQRRSWGRAVAAAVLMSISISFLVGKTAKRRWSPIHALAAAVAPKDLPPRVAPFAPKPAGHPVTEEIAANEETVQPAIVPPPPAAHRADRSRSGTRDRRPSQASWTYLAATRRLHPAADPFPVDEDDTMPPSEP
jgi:serine/threonine protein kinase